MNDNTIKITMPLIQQVQPGYVASQILGVQPMASSTGISSLYYSFASNLERSKDTKYSMAKRFDFYANHVTSGVIFGHITPNTYVEIYNELRDWVCENFPGNYTAEFSVIENRVDLHLIFDSSEDELAFKLKYA